MATVAQMCVWVPVRPCIPISQKTVRNQFGVIRSCKALGTDRSSITANKSLKDYFEEAEALIDSFGGSDSPPPPPRWFSPLECRLKSDESPLLLYLPGIDGVGLGLILQHQNLGKLFDIWCLHIPVMDRTSFQDLVLLVEETVRSESQRLKGKTIYLLGESLGACLALAIAARNPHVDIVLILANPGTSYCNSPLQYLLPVLEHLPVQPSDSVAQLLSLISGECLNISIHLQKIVPELSQGLALLSSYHSVLAKILPRETLLWKLKMLKSASFHANSCLHTCQAQILVLASANCYHKSSPKHSGFEVNLYCQWKG